MIPEIIAGLVQVLTVLALSPLMVGILKKWEAKFESRKGITIFQPYYDLAKFFKKEIVVSEDAGSLFILAPMLSFTAYLILPWVVPIVFGSPSWFAPLVDFLGGAFLFGFASFFSVIGTEKTGSYYTGIGATRGVTFGAFAEPVLITVFFGVALITGTNNPFLTNETLRNNLSWMLSPTHLLLIAAFFLLLLFDTGKLPIESHGMGELGMIGQGMGLEYSGPLYALKSWGSYMKQFILFSVFINVFAMPWFIPLQVNAITILYGIALLFVKMLVVIFAIVLVEISVAKIRLFKIVDYLTFSYLTALLAVISFFLVGGVPQ